MSAGFFINRWMHGSRMDAHFAKEHWRKPARKRTGSTSHWREDEQEEQGKHGLLFIHSSNPQQVSILKFFPSRLEMYLSLLNCLSLSADSVDSLPKVYMEVTVPTQILNVRSAPTGSSKL